MFSNNIILVNEQSRAEQGRAGQDRTGQGVSERIISIIGLNKRII